MITRGSKLLVQIKMKHNQSGMTIMELMVAVALSSMVLVAMGLITQALFAAKRDVEDYETEKDLIRAEYLVRAMALTAVDVQGVTTSPAAGTARGWINTAYTSAVGTGIQAIGAFRREAKSFPYPDLPPSQDPTPIGNSKHIGSGIFFIPPQNKTATSPYRSGVLFLDFGNENDATASVAPSYKNEVVANLVSFRTFDGETTPVAGRNVLTAFSVELIYRKFRPTGPEKPKCFLPTGCPTTVPDITEEYYDRRRLFRVLLLNSDLGPSPFGPLIPNPLNPAVNIPDPQVRERTLGRVYFYKLTSPLMMGQGL